MFFVARVYTAYFDESYTDGFLMCVGGWLASDTTWGKIEGRWRRRIEYEKRRSIKRGESAIDRYHASDLDNLKSQFAQEKGWDADRRKLFTKKLIDIMACNKQKINYPIGISVGIFLSPLRELFPSPNKENIYKQHWAAYRICMIQNLITLAEVMRRLYPGEQVAVIYDRGPFSSAALSAFESFVGTSRTVNKKDIVTVAPMGWECCTALQPADMIVYESRKLIKSGIREQDKFRRSLQRIIGNGNILRVRYIGREALAEIRESRRLAPPPSPDFSTDEDIKKH
jgi:hypothetical protein